MYISSNFTVWSDIIALCIDTQTGPVCNNFLIFPSSFRPYLSFISFSVSLSSYLSILPSLSISLSPIYLSILPSLSITTTFLSPPCPFLLPSLSIRLSPIYLFILPYLPIITSLLLTYHLLPSLSISAPPVPLSLPPPSLSPLLPHHPPSFEYSGITFRMSEVHGSRGPPRIIIVIVIVTGVIAIIIITKVIFYAVHITIIITVTSLSLSPSSPLW